MTMNLQSITVSVDQLDGDCPIKFKLQEKLKHVCLYRPIDLKTGRGQLFEECRWM